ncbi:MAG: transcriptional regulator [Eubacterium sp.]|nr:transcriptional regulator [Eubacterium sp.]
MSKDRVIEFLLRAKKATYASNGRQINSSRPQSHDLEYNEEELYYYDTYLGGERFSGEEAVWENGIPIWSMNYCGRVIGPGFDGNFLKEALLFVPVDKPYRGPESYTKNNFSYKCYVEGEFDWFIGHEEIYLKKEKIFECVFHGGAIK